MKVSKGIKITFSILLLALGVIYIVPLLWLVFTAFDADPSLVLRIPEEWTIYNFLGVLYDETTSRSFLMGSIIALSSSIFALALTMFAAYPLSRVQIKHKDKIMYGLLFISGLPMIAVVLPIYIAYSRIGWVDKLAPMIAYMIASGLPYSIWLQKNFIDTIPIELEEAARIDGASQLQIIFRILIPSLKQTFLMLFLFSFIGGWGTFFIPFILLNSTDKMPPGVVIYQFFNDYGGASLGGLAAYSILYMLPALIVYIIAQKFLVKGVNLAGAIK